MSFQTSLSGIFKSYGIWIIIVLLSVFNIALLRQNQQMRSQLEFYQPKELKIGDKISDFTAKTLDGEIITVDFSNTAKKRFLLYFTPTGQYCKQQFPDWKELISQTKNENIEIYGVVSENEKREDIENYLNKFDCGTTSKMPLKVIFVTNEVLQKNNLTLTPTTVLLSSDGKVEQNWTGRWKESDKTLALNLIKN